MNKKPTKTPIKRLSLETLSRQEDKILNLLREERQRAKERFPLPHALLATFGLACTLAGLNKIIADIDFLNNNPITMVVVGVTILLATGAAYKKLG